LHLGWLPFSWLNNLLIWHKHINIQCNAFALFVLLTLNLNICLCFVLKIFIASLYIHCMFKIYFYKTKHKWDVVALSSCRIWCTPNGAFSCGVLSRCHIVARLKSKYLAICAYKSQGTGWHRDNDQHENAPFGVLR
jgi:hypothetical protein